MTPIDIFITSFFRPHFTLECVNKIWERTKHPFRIHIWDNASSLATQDLLVGLLRLGKITSLHLESRNTMTMYPKSVFNSMACGKYYCVTDADCFPPLLDPDWLTQMVGLMETHTDVAFLTPQYPPISMFGCEQKDIQENIVFCKHVGNVFKLVRKKMFPSFPQSDNFCFGDDSEVCRLSYGKSAFCRRIFAYHAGQCKDWGYQENEIALDPRKKNYKPPMVYDVDPITCVPINITLTLGYP